MDEEGLLALRTEAEKIMKLPGNTKGSSLSTDRYFIQNKEGEGSVERLEVALSELGYPFSYSEVKGFEWYKEAQSVLGIFVAKKLFSWSKKDLFEMGYAAPSTSILVKVALHFVSLEKTFRQAPGVWEKHYDFGSFEPLEFNETERLLRFQLKGYPFFNWMQDYFDGFFTRIMHLVGIRDIQRFESRWVDESDHSCRLYEVRWR